MVIFSTQCLLHPVRLDASHPLLTHCQKRYRTQTAGCRLLTGVLRNFSTITNEIAADLKPLEKLVPVNLSIIGKVEASKKGQEKHGRARQPTPVYGLVIRILARPENNHEH